MFFKNQWLNHQLERFWNVQTKSLSGAGEALNWMLTSDRHLGRRNSFAPVEPPKQ